MATKTADRPMTDAQAKFLFSLIDTVGEQFAQDALNAVGAETALDLNIRSASKAIDVLKREADRIRAAKRAESAVVREAEKIVSDSTLSVGVYMREGTPIRVYPSQRGHLLAKALENGSWVYKGAAYRFVTPEMKMTVEQATQYGLDFGTCACCGRLLEDPASVALGIGPVCLKKYF